ncbi:unnamed protein product [Penicillium camemberti]|uniref:Str. FM013 n=1 Tax=Penicillium camemberti (strain FM 013) TaxID=1429867 RepID=A0A0G4PUQ6_PENC3|nr:unnamed protein product [Penicillium camemberti]
MSSQQIHCANQPADQEDKTLAGGPTPMYIPEAKARTCASLVQYRPLSPSMSSNT